VNLNYFIIYHNSGEAYSSEYAYSMGKSIERRDDFSEVSS